MTSPFEITPEQKEREVALSTPAGHIGTHTGVILRVQFQGQTYMQADSDHLHMMAQLGGHPISGGWSEVLRTIGGLTIEVQPTRLPNDYPDPAGQADSDPDDDDPAGWQG